VTSRTVYTALIGGYETLTEQPMASTSDIEFVCFTDDASLTSETWRIELVEPAFPLDPVRSARMLKTRGGRRLGVEESLWIDNTVLLKRDPSEILEEWLAAADLAIPRHSYRASVIAEFEEVLRLGYDEASRVYEQLRHYVELAPETLEDPALWTAIIARRHSPEVEEFMERWFLDIVRFSRRDQLSVRKVLHDVGLHVDVRQIDNRESPMHTWPSALGRRTDRATAWSVADLLQPPAARIGQLELELGQAVTSASEGIRVREQRIRELEAALAEREAELQRMIASLEEQRGHTLGRRLTAPARWLRRRLRRS